MRVTCPTCSRVVPGNDIDLAARSALCRPCGEVFAIAMPGATGGGGPAGKLYKPTDMRWTEVRERPTRYVVTVRPSRWQGAFLGLFATFWNGILWTVAAAMILGGKPQILGFLSLHLGAGLFIAYLAAVGLLNRSRLVIDGEHLELASGPVPQRGNLRIPLSEIDGFAVAEYGQFGRNTTKAGFGVSVQTRDGRAVRLRVSFGDREQTQFAAQRLTQMVEDVRAAAADAQPYRGGLRVDVPADAAIEASDDIGESTADERRRA